MTEKFAINYEAAWRRALVCWGLLLCWILFWYRDTALAMATIWSRSDTYAHGFLVPLISLWLIWRQRQSLSRLFPKAGVAAWLLMAGCAALWLLGDLVAVNAATQLALTALVVLSVPAMLGWQVASALMFPLAFLFFAVPIGDFMMPQLMEWTADFTVLALRFSGIPVFREGQQFVIPSGNWSVVEACSGIRYLIASVTVGSLFAYLSYQTTRRRLVFIGVSFLVPILANWLRAYMIVMLGHYSGNTLATGVDHIIYGWLFFGLVIMIMFMIGARWAQPMTALPLAPDAGPAKTSTVASPRLVPVSALVLAVLVVAPHAVNWALQQNQNPRPPALAGVPPQAGWQQAGEPFTDWKPAFINPATQSQTGYTGPQGATVGLYIGYYRNQNYERKLVSSENMLVTTTDPLWARVSGGTGSATFRQQPITVRTAELRRLRAGLSGDESRLLVWQFYWVNGHLTASDPVAKIRGALGRLMGQGDDGAAVILYTPRQPAAAATLQSFVDAHAAAIEAALQQTRSRP